MIQEEQDRVRRLEKIRALGMEPYPPCAQRTHNIGDFLSNFDSLAESKQEVTLVGRIRLSRSHGGLTFLEIQDESARVQLALKKDIVGETSYKNYQELMDIGDFLEVSGSAFLTKKGEKTLLISSWRIMAKALLPLPEKWHGLTDVEIRYRERELDLIVHPEVKDRFIKRAALIRAMRGFLDERGFIEVETPILQSIPGGANARPFSTHHHALDQDLYLRIAPELYLKRLIIAGFEKVYEIGRSFRNEGIDVAHNPEFTSIELYWAFVSSQETFTRFLEKLMRHIIHATIGALHVPYGKDVIDFESTWSCKTFREAILEDTGIDIDAYTTEASLKKAVEKKGLTIDFDGCIGIGEYYDQLYKKTAREHVTNPTWIFDYPLPLKPLASVSPHDPTKSASVQLVIHGVEIINAYYHELNDPIEQRKRFLDQEELRKEGSEVAQRLDEEFLQAMAHGMPPTSGMAIGIDRLVAFLTNAPNLKEVILFPTLRSKKM